MNTKSLPIINLSKNVANPGTSSWAFTSNAVRLALEEFGCFIALYDDIPVEFHHKVFDVLRELYSLSSETKAKNISNKPFHGYSKPAYPLHLLESFGIENAQDPEKAMSFTNLMWPSGNQDFCKTINLYSKLGSGLEQLVKRMVFESYGVESYLTSLDESTDYLLRVAKYRVPREGENRIGSLPHSDKSFLTVLHQNDVDGLEIQTKDGQWINYEASAQSFVVMAGEAFLAWSNNRIHAPVHRVVMKGDRTRYSLGIFSFINGILATPKELIDKQHQLRFKPFDHYGLLHFYWEQSGFSEITVKDYCGI